MNTSRKRQHLDQQQLKEEPEEEDGDGDNDTRSMVGANSEWSFHLEEDNGNNIGNGTGNELSEVELKIAALEAKNKMLESKLKNLELKAENRALKEESNLSKLREENTTIRQKLKDAEEQAQMTKNEFESTIKEIQRKMAESATEMAVQKEEFQKQKQDFEEAKMANIELTQKMTQIEVDFANKLAILEEHQKNKWAEMKVENEAFEIRLAEEMVGNVQIANIQFSQQMENVEENYVKKLASLEKKQENKLDKNMSEFTKKLASLKGQHTKQIGEFKAKIEEIKEDLDTMRDAQEANNKNAQIQQMNQQKMEEFGREMTILKEQIALIQLKSAPAELPGSHLVKCKRHVNATPNRWNAAKTMVTICSRGLNAMNNTNTGTWLNVFAQHGFNRHHCQRDFPDPILYYFEVTRTMPSACAIYIGLSADGHIPPGYTITSALNSYAYSNGYDYDYCFMHGRQHLFEWPSGAIKPTWNWPSPGDILGCGLLLRAAPENKLAIFFTVNGILMGKQIPIMHYTNYCLVPTISMDAGSVEANFGDNLATKPFKYDIEQCPGLVFK